MLTPVASNIEVHPKTTEKANGMVDQKSEPGGSDGLKANITSRFEFSSHQQAFPLDLERPPSAYHVLVPDGRALRYNLHLFAHGCPMLSAPRLPPRGRFAEVHRRFGDSL